MSTATSPWTSWRTWSTAPDQETRGSKRASYAVTRISPSASIVCVNDRARQRISALIGQRWVTPNYRWCIDAVVTAILADDSLTAKQVWEDFCSDRGLSPADAQEYSNYCFLFQTAWIRVGRLARF